jgi:hypothetical protein
MKRNSNVAVAVATLMFTAALPGLCQNAVTQNTHAVKANIQQPTPPPVAAELRDPFTPVDIPPAPTPQTPIDNQAGPGDTPPPPPPPVASTWPKLPVKALMTDPSGKHVAMIEGVGSVEAGDIVSKKVEGVIYRWRIELITDKDVSFKKLDARPADGPRDREPTPQPPAQVPPLPLPDAPKE